jgi:GNAT superfamily N-acetyltransferase
MTFDIEISTDPTRLDIDLIHRHLSSSYWAMGRSRAVVEMSIRNSLSFGAYQEGRQAGFGRVITDYATFAYLADIIVFPESQGHGVGKAIVKAMTEHPQLRDIRIMLLRTRDAHRLYEKFGFGVVPEPNELMARYA